MLERTKTPDLTLAAPVQSRPGFLQQRHPVGRSMKKPRENKSSRSSMGTSGQNLLIKLRIRQTETTPEFLPHPSPPLRDDAAPHWWPPASAESHPPKCPDQIENEILKHKPVTHYPITSRKGLHILLAQLLLQSFQKRALQLLQMKLHRRLQHLQRQATFPQRNRLRLTRDGFTSQRPATSPSPFPPPGRPSRRPFPRPS